MGEPFVCGDLLNPGSESFHCICIFDVPVVSRVDRCLVTEKVPAEE